MNDRAIDRLETARRDRKAILKMLDATKKGVTLAPNLNKILGNTGETHLQLSITPVAYVNPYIRNTNAGTYILECALQECEKAIVLWEKKARREALEVLGYIEDSREVDSLEDRQSREEGE